LWSANDISAVIKDAHEGSGESMQMKSLQSHITLLHVFLMASV